MPITGPPSHPPPATERTPPVVPRADGQMRHRPPAHRRFVYRHTQRITQPASTAQTLPLAQPQVDDAHAPPWKNAIGTSPRPPPNACRTNSPSVTSPTTTLQPKTRGDAAHCPCSGLRLKAPSLGGKSSLAPRRSRTCGSGTQPPGTHLVLNLEGEAAIKIVHTAEGDNYVMANADTAVWLHAHEDTAPPTTVPGLHPWHVIIVHPPTGTHTGDAQQGWADRWAHVWTTLHDGLRKRSLTSDILEPAPITAESYNGTAPPTRVWAYTRTLQRGAAEALKNIISSHQSLVHSAHDNMQKGYTLWWHHPAPEGGLQPPAD